MIMSLRSTRYAFNLFFFFVNQPDSLNDKLGVSCEKVHRDDSWKCIRLPYLDLCFVDGFNPFLIFRNLSLNLCKRWGYVKRLMITGRLSVSLSRCESIEALIEWGEMREMGNYFIYWLRRVKVKVAQVTGWLFLCVLEETFKGMKSFIQIH